MELSVKFDETQSTMIRKYRKLIDDYINERIDESKVISHDMYFDVLNWINCLEQLIGAIEKEAQE